MGMWFVYLVECSDKTYYCGITNDIEKRIARHNSGKGAKYTRGRAPVELICSVSVPTKSKALQVEYAVKKQPRKNKVQYLQKMKID